MWQETKRIFLESVGSMLQSLARVLPSAIAMLLISGAFAVLAVAVRVGVLRASDRFGFDRRLREWGVVGRASGERAGPSRLVARVAFWFVFLLGLFLGLRVLDTPGAA